MIPRTPQGRYLLLGLLDLGDMSGYDLKQVAAQSVGFFWREGYGQIYPTLQLLEREGLIKSRSERRTGRPQRKVFSLQETGRAHLRGWLKEPAAEQVPRNELLLKLFFGHLASKTTAREHLAQKKQSVLAELQTYAQLREALRGDKANRREKPYWLMTLRYGERTAKAELDWCNELLSHFDRSA